MKIDRSKLKKSSSEVSADCQELIERLKSCPDLLAELQQIKAWNYGKSELYQWVDVLDKFDAILEEASNTPPDHSWHLTCDRPENKHLEDLVHAVLTFTALLVEHSFSRHLYNSVEHLTALLASSNLNTVLAVLNLVYVFSKRSNFLIKLSQGKRQELFQALTYLAESWGGKDNGFGLAECCRMGENENIPNSATTLHFEFYSDNFPPEEKVPKKHSAQALTIVHIENVDKLSRDCAAIMEELISKHNIPKDKQMLLFTHVRLAHCFSNPEQRLLCVQARLQALSVLVYSSAIQDITSTLLYTGLVEELVDVLQIENPLLVEIKAASLRTLTAVIHLDRNPELVNIIEATGASSYHGFLPVLVRQCIQAMIDPQQEAVPHVLATALFSFLYHLASYGTGGEALVFCNMMESLLKVIKWHGEDEQLHTTFVTRAVRVVDLITNLDMAAFQTNGGLSIFLNRLEHEVNICRNEVPYVIRPTIRTSTREPSMSNPASPIRPIETDVSAPAEGGATASNLEQGESSGLSTSQSGEGPSEMETDSPGPSSSSVLDDSYFTGIQGKSGRQCFPQRAALLKSMLNFLKKAIPDPAFADSIRHVMDGSLPRSLKHLISNAEYYGPSLFLLACEFVTVYVFQEPSLLSCLQDTGLTDVMLHALLIKDVPATKEVLGSLPNIFSALCLNARGLEAFVKCKPFDKLFKVLLSPAYLPAMRRRRSNEIMGDTALSLGSAMDELMRHQPSLKSDAMKAIIKLLEEICSLGRDKRYTCAKTPPKGKTSAASAPQTAGDDTSSDDDDDEEAVTEEIRNPTEVTVQKREADLPQSTDSEEKKPIPLLDYIFNVMKFVEAILCTNATDDHCWEFVGQKGHEPLMEILRLPNLPIDFPSSQACQSVASVCKAILSLAREPQVLKQGLQLLKEVLQRLEPLNQPLQPPGGSILLRELLDSPNPPEAPLSAGATPLLHSVVSAHSYVTMLFHVCRVGQGDVRNISINQWGTDLGQEVLGALCKLYTSLVWESIVLLSLFTPGSIPDNCDLGKQDMTKLMELTADMQEGKKVREQFAGSAQGLTASFGPGESPTTAVSSALSSMEMEDAQPSEEVTAPKDAKMNLHMLHQLKQEVPALYAPSRLGRALSELFGLLVKLCVGSSMRHRIRPNPQANQTVPSEAARKTARTLMELLMSSLLWRPPTADALPKFRLTFYICTVSFASPMLFDDKKQPYHLMLQKFFSSGAHKALFEAFNWALSPENPFDKEGSKDLSEGTCEFIDAWLVLIKKMVNPESILESPHSMPAKSTQQGFVPFQPVQFLINTHKAAFHSLMKLWNSGHLKNLGSRTSESVLSILCHILRGEAVIAERLKQAKAEEGPSGSSEGAAGTSGALSSRSRLGGASSSFLASEILGGWGSNRQRQEPSEEHILQLMDMGFSRDHAIDALNHTASLPQAAEWAISHQPRLTQDLSTGMTEEEEMLQAIAMSLGETLVSSTHNKADEEEKKKKEEEEKRKKEEEQKKLEAKEKIPEEAPLREEDLDNFVNGMLPGCLALMDDVPDIVARVCDLLVIANERNGSEWRDNMLQTLIGQIAENALLLEQLALDDSSKLGSIEENRNQLNSVPQAPRLAARIHLLCLLFDEMKMPCARMIESSGVLDVFVRLVHVSQQYLRTSKDAATPKWLAPLLLLLDLYEKAVVSFRRKLAWVNTASHQWKWFDDSSGRWCPYSRGNNKTIDDAFWAGKSSVRFTAARRRYVVNFNRMVQVNEETMNRRPIMQALKTEEVPKKDEETTKGNKKQKTEMGASEAGTSSQSLGASAPDEKEQVAEQPDIVEVEGLSEDQMTSLLRSCIGLIGVPVEPDALHAVLRLCLRFTRNHQHALMFADMGGPRLLLSLTLSSSFNGFSLLATLLLRHIFESKSVLTNTMEKLISTVANKGVGCLTCNVALGSVGSRELHYALRMLGPPACRDEEVYLKAAKSCLKVDVPNSKREISHSTNPNTMLLLKGITPPELQPAVTLDEHAKQVLSDLLESLVIPVEPMEETKAPEAKKEVIKDKGTGKAGDNAVEMAGVGLREIGDELLCFYSSDRQNQRSATSSASVRMETGMDAAVLGEDELPEAGSIISMASSSSSQGKKSVTDAATTPETKSKPLISKSAILRLLAELVKPYMGCAQYVAQYQFIVCQTPHAKEDGSALAFILDNLLPQTENTGDKDCPAQAQVLLASLASCNHSPEAQATLVSEVKGALQRALALPESKEKHARIQALTQLIGVMIDACPSTATTPSNTTVTGGSPAAAKSQTPTVNNITRLLLKKGFVTDLARITHSLDLSSPNMAATINSALKPLDTLSRMVNQAPAGSKGSLKSKLGRNDLLRTSRSSRPRTSGGSTLRTSNTVHSELEEIVGELLEQQERRPDVLGETLIAAGPERLDSFQSSFLNQGGEDASQDEMVITMTEDGADIEQTPRDSEMQSQPSQEEEESVIPDFEVEEENDSAADSESERADEEGQDDEADDDEEEEEDDEADEDDDDSDMEEAEEYDITEDLDYFRMGDTGDRDDFFIPLDEVSTGETVRQSTIPGLEGRYRSYQMPVSVHNEVRPSTGITGSGAFTTTTPSATHPLLVRHTSDDAGTSHTSAQTRNVSRGARQRLHVRPGTGNSQTVHIYHSGAHRPLSVSAVLRLLGMSSTSDVVQVSQTGNQTRVYVSNSSNELGGGSSTLNDDILNLDDGMRETFRDGYLSSSDLSSNVTPVYKRWDEEASILDGESMFDCIEALKRPIIEVLEKRRDQEIAEKKEKMKKQAEEEAKKKAEDAKKVKQAAAKAEAKALLGSGKKKLSVGAVLGGASGAASSQVEEKDEEERMEISDNGEKTSGEPSSAASDEAIEIAPTSEPCGAAAAAVATTSSISTASTPTLGTDIGADIGAIGGILQLSSSLPDFELAEQPQGSSTPMASPATAGGEDKAERPSSTSPMETSTQQAEAQVPTTVTTTPTVPGTLTASLTSATTSSTDAVTGVTTTTSAATGAASATTTTQSSTHPVSTILSTTGEVTLNTLLTGTASNIGAASTTPLQSGDRVMAESALVKAGTEGTGVSTAGVTGVSDTATAATAPAAEGGDLQLPEGVDPSFLAALPDNIRQEVLQEHLGIQSNATSSTGVPKPPTTSTTTATTPTTNTGTTGETPAASQVDPEFLAALPPHIQEEVLAEERAEQQRLQQASQQQTTAASSEPMDPAAFIQTLPRSLRQSVLSDLDHSMLALLPADLAAEAQALRLECARVIRRRQLLQERYIRESGRISGITGQGMNYYRLSAPRRTGASWANDFGHRPQSRIGSNLLSGSQVQGRQLVDLEALTCLLVLLFLNEPKLNLVLLWRVLRNLSFHPPTRNWILLSLLSILEKTKACRTVEGQRSSENQSPVGDMEAPFSSKNAMMPSWLSVSMDAALGCRASIFQVQRGNRKGSDRQPANVFIHPQAASMVCQNVLDTLYALADNFPQQFIPDPVAHAKILKQKDDSKIEMKESDETISPESGAIQKGSHQKSEPDFWELLVKLDSTSLGRKGKGTSKPTLLLSGKDIKDPSWGDSPVARLLAMLSHPVVKRSTALTDKLLHLLTLVTASLPDKERVSSAGSGIQRQAATSSRMGTATLSAMAVSVPSCQSTEGASTATPGESATPMDTSTTGDSDTLKLKTDGAKDEAKTEEKTLVEERLLQLAVEVLTTHTCSGDGLEEATTLLMHLSRSHAPTREAVLRLLLSGAQELGFTLCRDINQLKTEVTEFLRRQKEQESMGEGDSDEPSTSSGATPGILVDRYNQNKKVVVSVPASGSKRSGFELRLPSMVSFTGKTANQTVFLRILKVIIQLRDLAKSTPASKAKPLKHGGEYSEMSNAVAALARSASEMMAQRESERQSHQATADTPTVSLASAGASSTTTDPSVGSVTPAPDTRAPSEAGSSVGTVPPTPDIAAPSETGSSAMATPVSSGTEVPMEIDPPQKPEASTSSQADAESTKAEDEKENQKEPEEDLERLSLLLSLEELWETLSVCLTMLSQTPDPHAVLVLQPAVEAFFLVHASDKNTAKLSETQLHPPQSSASETSQSSSQPVTPSLGSVPSGLFFSRESSVTSIVTPNMPADTQKFLRFAEKHRSVLNQILRQSTVHLSEGPFAVLVNHVRILDFDVKRRYFRQELERLDEGSRREDMAIHVRREHVFEDSYRELHRKSAEHWKDKFYVVFEGEEGQDAGGLLREWYLIISKEIFNPMYALFRTSPGDRVTYIPNPSSHYNPNHLSYFKFVGRIIAKAIYDNKLLECYFSRSFYKHILGKAVTYSDMESEDYAFYQGLVFLLEHHISELGYELTFSTEIDVFGVTETRELKDNGASIPVTEDNKLEYVRLVCQMKMTHAISQQIRSFLEGFHEIIPKRLISIFDEQELELLISGLPTVDVDDLKANTEYHKYQSNSLQIQWFWRALRSFDQALRAKFIQFVTGTSKVPLQGFGSLEGMNGPQKFQIHRDDRSTDRLPTAHTCFNQLDLPAYETYDKLRQMLLLAIEECPEGFGLA